MPKRRRINIFLKSIARIDCEIHLRKARERDRGGERSDESVNRDVEHRTYCTYDTYFLANATRQ